MYSFVVVHECAYRLQELKSLHKTMITGEPSLQNSLEMAIKSLRLLPSHSSKEILIIIGALTTCDPGDINETIRVCFVIRVHILRTHMCVSVEICFKHF